MKDLNQSMAMLVCVAVLAVQQGCGGMMEKDKEMVGKDGAMDSHKSMMEREKGMEKDKGMMKGGQ